MVLRKLKAQQKKKQSTNKINAPTKPQNTMQCTKIETNNIFPVSEDHSVVIIMFETQRTRHCYVNVYIFLLFQG